MTDTPKPLTRDEIAEWKAGYGSSPTGVARDVLRLIATIEQRDEQIEKLRALAAAVAEDVRHLAAMIDEALATTEKEPTDAG